MSSTLSDYIYESIGNQIKVCTSKQHTFGTDSFLLADFAKTKPNDRAVDLGTGCGIIPMLWMRDNPPNKIIGVEVQSDAVEQFRLSIKASMLDKTVKALHADLKDIHQHLPAGAFSLVVCNPPYSVAGSGLKSPEAQRLIARHETLCTMDDIAKAARWLLQTGGRFCVCQRPERLTDVMLSMRQHQIEPKRLRMVQQKCTDAPWLVLVEGKRMAKPGLVIEPPLLMKVNGQASKEISEIYKHYGRL